MRRRLNLWLTAVLLCVFVLAGCAAPAATGPTPAAPAQPTAAATQAPAQAPVQTPAQTAQPAEDTGLTAPGTYPIFKEKTTMTALCTPNTNIVDMNTNYVTGWFEDLTNVHIEWETVASKDAAAKINLMIASSQPLPDFMVGGSLVADKMAQYVYGKQGTYLPLEWLIADNAPGIVAMLAEEPQLLSQMTAPDGHIYSVGNFEITYHSTFYMKAWINETWLDALGMSKPATTDELYAVLSAFKTGDPNGNKQADEIPFSAIPGVFQATAEGWLMNSFVYDDVNKRLNLTDGKVWVPYNTPEWREGLRFFNKLYSEGLLDPESFTQDGTQIKQLVDGEVVRLGLGMGSSPMQFASSTSENWHSFSVLEPVTGPNGFRTTAYYPPVMGDGRFVITKDCKNPEAAIRWLDVFYDTDRSLSIWFGEEGVDWKKSDPGDIGLDGQPAYWEEINILRTMPQQNKGWLHLGPRYGVRDIVSGRAQPGGGDPWYHETIMFNATKIYDELGIAPKEVLPPLFFSDTVAGEYAEIKTALDTYVNESFARFVIGDLDVENDWDAYLKEFEAIGLNRYVEIHQEAFDAMN